MWGGKSGEQDAADTNGTMDTEDAAAENVPENGEETTGQTVEQETAAGTEEQGISAEQYGDMAEKFTMYCEYVYLGYEEYGEVTVKETHIEEDTDSQCRITVYYHEPDIDGGNQSSQGGNECIGFAIDKAASQGKMEFWNYLGTEGDAMEIDMTGEAAAYYDFPEGAVFDFKEGTILSSGDVVADVAGYFE